MIKAIPYFKEKAFCPVIYLKNWLEISKINKGFIFNISDKMVAILIKKYLLAAGFDPKKYSGHSLRSGFATTAASFGADEKSIMTMTGWYEWYHPAYVDYDQHGDPMWCGAEQSIEDCIIEIIAL